MHLSSNLDGASLFCILYAYFRPALAGLFFFHHDLLVYLLLQLRYMGDNAHQAVALCQPRQCVIRFAEGLGIQ